VPLKLALLFDARRFSVADLGGTFSSIEASSSSSAKDVDDVTDEDDVDGDFEDAFKDDETDERPRRSLNNAAMVAIPGAILKIVARRTDASKVQRFSMIIYLETADHMLKFRILFRFGFRSIILGICRFSA
jgi:hypothetical protein